MKKFPNGTSVRIVTKYTANGRTGVVVDDDLKFPWRDSRAVKFDAPFHNLRPEYIPESELREIKLSDRPAGSLPPEKRQLGLFGEAA
ncbi:MAG: hypothetical protein Q8K32_31455 [Archangium sp.]|nr:hypothetical protein [Archangium sp.]